MKGEGYYKIWRAISSGAACYVRKQFFDLFMTSMNPGKESRILDVGALGGNLVLSESDNYFERLYPWPEKITAVGLEDASYLEKEYPGLKFLKADGTNLPFSNNSFDIVFSSAVAEHVGSYENQKKFYKEILRVGQKAFITTPDRLFPIEVHTGLPLLHYLPKNIHRAMLKILGLHYFADEVNLNLLNHKNLEDILVDQPGARIMRKLSSLIVIKK